MLEAALYAQVNTYICCYCQEREKNGYVLMLCNGRYQASTLQGSPEQLHLHFLRPQDIRDDQTKTSSLLLPYLRKTVTCLLAVWQGEREAWPQRRVYQHNDSWRRAR